MSDPLSVAASVLTIIGSGFAIAEGLYKLAEGIGSAGEQVRVHAKEIQLFSELLLLTREELLRDVQSPRPRAERLIMDILDVFETLLEPSNKLQALLNPLLLRYSDSQRKLYQINLRIRWLFSIKHKLLWYRESLRVLNGVLNTTLMTMKTPAEINNSFNLHIRCNSIEMHIADIRRSLAVPTQLRLDGFLQPMIPPPSLLHRRITALEETSTSPAIPPGPSNVRQQITYPTQEASQSSSSDNQSNQQARDTSVDDTIDGDRQSQTFAASSSQESEPIHDLDDPEIDEIVSAQQNVTQTLDSQFDGSAQAIWEELRSVSRKVLRYAEDMLRDCSQAQAQPTQPQDPQPRRPQQDSQPNTIPRKAINKDSRQSPVVETRRDKTSPAGGIGGQESLKARDYKVGVDETITLKNVDGKTYQVPYAAVQEWKDAQAVWESLPYPRLYNVNQSRGGVDVDDIYDVYPAQVFKQGFFELIGPDGQNIIPRLWAWMVKPGWTVELRLRHPISWRKPPRQSRGKESPGEASNGMAIAGRPKGGSKRRDKEPSQEPPRTSIINPTLQRLLRITQGSGIAVRKQ